MEKREKQRHHVKAWPNSFAALAKGRPFTVRRDDRDYQEGDHLVVEEHDPNASAQSGRVLVFLVTDVVSSRGPDNPVAGLLSPSAVVLGLKRLRFEEAGLKRTPEGLVVKDGDARELCGKCGACVLRTDGSCFVCDGPRESFDQNAADAGGKAAR